MTVTKEQHIENGFNCPKCGSDGFLGGYDNGSDLTELVAMWHCNKCKAKWSEVYILDRVEVEG